MDDTIPHVVNAMCVCVCVCVWWGGGGGGGRRPQWSMLFYAPLTDTEIGTLNPRFMEILQLLSVRLSDLWLSFVSSGAHLACF